MDVQTNTIMIKYALTFKKIGILTKKSCKIYYNVV